MRLLLAFTLQGARSDLIPPGLVVWGVAGPFRLIQRALGAKWGLMLGGGAGGGLYNTTVIQLTKALLP